MMQEKEAIALTVGPLQYWWSRPALMAFYAEVAESPARCVVLGELVCSRRNEYKLEDWVALGRDLRAAGKEVVLATQALVMSEAELRTLRHVVEQDEFAVEAGDASALRVLWQAGQARPQRPGFTLGPHVNIYSREALQEHAALGATRWVPPLELALDAIGRINPGAQRVTGPGGPVQTEVFAFGRMPLAFSARCFTARHHRLNKDECEFRCRDDADGLLLKTSEGDAFLVLNGIQTQSAALHCLVGDGDGDALRAAGASSVRLSPCSRGFARVLALFHEVLNGTLPAAQARAELATLDLPGALVNGFALRQAGMQPLLA
jgi:collagenase-like PrtC family protease